MDELHAVTDVTSWAVIGYEQAGRDPGKLWLAPDADAPRHDQWLWKPRQATGAPDSGEYRLLDCVEVAVSRLALLLTIPAAECRYAVKNGLLGVISRNVAPVDHDLYTAHSYLSEVPGFVRQSRAPDDRMDREEGYTLEAVGLVLRDVAPPPGVPDMSAQAVFAGYLVLDALVGNTDRHPGNWALLESADGRRALGPTFDHGSALGANLTERNRCDKDPKAWARRGLAKPFTPRGRSLVALACEAVGCFGGSEWITRVAALGQADFGAILEAPDGRMSDAASTFMEQVMLENQRRLSDGDDVAHRPTPGQPSGS